MKEKCKKCKVLEKLLEKQALRYDALERATIRGTNLHDVDRNIAEIKILQLFREGDVFSPVGMTRGNYFVSSGLAQSFDPFKAIDILTKLIKTTL